MVFIAQHQWSDSVRNSFHLFNKCRSSYRQLVIFDNRAQKIEKSMKKGTIMMVANLLLSHYIFAQNIDWLRTVGSTGSDYSNSVCQDDLGNIYTCGYFEGTIDLDPGPGLQEFISFGGSDAFIQKLDPSGNFLWARSFGGLYTDQAASVTVDPDGNVYITGHFMNTVDFDPGPGTYGRTAVGGKDIYVMKLDASGNYLGSRAFGGSSNDQGNIIKADPYGHVYITGFFSTTTDFDPGSGGLSSHTSAGSLDAFVLKLNPTWGVAWVSVLGGADVDMAWGIEFDADDKVYVAGIFSQTVDFDPGPGSTTYTSAAGYDACINKLDSAGNFIWAKAISGPNHVEAYSIKLDDLQNIYVVGDFWATPDFDPGPGTVNVNSNGFFDVYVLKLDSDGDFVWVKTIGGSGNDYGQSIELDASGDILIAGTYQGAVDFDPSTGSAVMTAAGGFDVFVQKLDNSGNFLWANSVGGSGTDQPYRTYLNTDGDLFVTGFFEETADFEPGSGTNNVVSNGMTDAFVFKMNQPTVGQGVTHTELSLSVSPNPTSETVYVNFGQFLPEVECSLLDLDGRLISTKVYHNVSSTVLDIPSATGVFILQVKTAKGQYVTRIVKS
ncbi:MAG: hypothetical protein RL266_2699 [Bacteroidota bacterium]